MTTKEFEEALELFFGVLARRAKKKTVFTAEAWEELGDCADECLKMLLN